MEERVGPLDLLTRVLGNGFVYWPMCLVGVALVALAVLGPEARRRLQIEHHCQVMAAEVESLRETRAQLEASALALESDPSYVEQVLRHDQRVVRPGEMALPGPVTAWAAGRPAATLEWQVPPVIALLAPWADRPWRLGALAAGAVLLVGGVIFSLPGRARRANARRKA